MEPVSLVVAALVAGASAGLSSTVGTAIGDAYQALKKLVGDQLRRSGHTEAAEAGLLDQIAASPSAKSTVTDALTRTGVDDPTRDAAQKLLDLLDGQGKYIVDASQAKGLQIGDNNSQHNTFN